MAIYNAMAAAVYVGFKLIILPVNMALKVLEVLWTNTFLTVGFVFLLVVLSVLAETSGGWIAFMVNLYNTGIGVTLQNEWIQPLVWIEIVAGALVPIYNVVLWLPQHLLLKIALPSVRLVPESVLVISGNSALFAGALAFSARTTMLRAVECAGVTAGLSGLGAAYTQSRYNMSTQSRYSMSMPFLEPNLECVANSNYMELDLMTPGIYLRNVAQAVEAVMVAGCSAGSLVISLAMYPLLDFNLYRAIHCFVNAILQVVLTVPLATWRRCQYGKRPVLGFSETEQAIMCTPDFTMTSSIVVSLSRSVGQLLQNWADAALIVVEMFLGQSSVRCTGNREATFVNVLWEEAAAVLQTPMTMASLSGTLLAMTDGYSTVYSSMTSGQLLHAVGNWPFPIDVLAGVAAVQHSHEMDADDGANERTGMLGCACIDSVVAATGTPQIVIVCASVPFRNTEVGDSALNSSTLIYTRFDSSSAADFMTCRTTKVRVSSLQFSRKRASIALDDGVDGSLRDILDAFGEAGVRDTEPYTADAAIYIQPECPERDTAACIGASSCYPFCMGLHVSGQNTQPITLYRAREWETFVHVAQVDCAGLADLTDAACEADPVQSASDAYDFLVTACPQALACAPNDLVRSLVPVEGLKSGKSGTSGNLSSLSLQQDNWFRVRRDEQPFVVAGDVMLFYDTASRSVVVTRLFDNNRGDYSLQNEQLTLASNAQGVPTAFCVEKRDGDRGADNDCHAAAVLAGQIVVPSASGLLRPGVAHPVAVSEWGIHWITNPEHSVIEAVFQQCQGRRQFSAVVWSSYPRPRIWTLKTMRLSSMGLASSASIDRTVSYMLVPDWIDDATQCTQQVNLQVLSLQYINAENVLVAVLRTTPQNFDATTNSVLQASLASTVFYYLHPNLHRCSELQDSNELVFTCWRAASEGMFQSTRLVSSVVLGTICPAARRTPALALAAAEGVVAGIETVRLVLDAVLVVTVALVLDGDLNTVYALRVNKPAFHSVLDASGTQLFNPDAVMEALDRAAVYGVQTLVKISDLLSSDGRIAIAATSTTILIGTARIMQHSSGARPLQGPMLRHWKVLSDTPLSTVMIGMRSSVPGMQSSNAMLTLNRFFSSMTSTLRVSAKILQRLMIKVLTNPRRVAGRALTQGTKLVAVGSALSAVLYESSQDMKRGWWDIARAQCYGVSNLMGTTTPVAFFFLNACLSVADGMEGTFEVLLVLCVDYPDMQCACKMTEGRNGFEVIRDTCLKRELPVQQSVLLKRVAAGLDGAPVNMCYVSMDAANFRLEHAFDRFHQRLFAAAAALGQSLDYVVSAWDAEAGDCSNFESPYVVTLIPEPVDYFMLCSHTDPCRAKCLDEFQAFENAQALVTAPAFVAEQTIEVDSRYFSMADIENDRHLPPFDVRALVELSPCAVVCAQPQAALHPRDRCVVVAGIADGLLATAYYCVPADITRYVSIYAGLPFPVESGQGSVYARLLPNEVVDGVYFLTVAGVLQPTPARETLLVLVRNFDQQYDKLLLMRPGGLVATLLQTAAGVSDAFQSIQAVRVVPQGEGTDALARVFVLGRTLQLQTGTQPLETGAADVLLPTTTCVFMRVDGFTQDAPIPRLADCTADIDSIFLLDHTATCLDRSCGLVLRLPFAASASSFIETQEVSESLQPTSVTRTTEMAAAVSSLLRVDKTRSIYRTQLHEAAVNTRHVADNTFSVRLSVQNSTHNRQVLEVCVLVSGVLDRREAWLQNLCLNLEQAGAAPSLSSSQLVEQDLQLGVVCALHSCVGCQDSVRSAKYEDLQSRCYVASQCAIAQCVGTIVNMRRPLCNMGALMTSVMEQYLLISTATWSAISSTVIVTVELSRARSQQYAITWPQESFHATVCQNKDLTLQAVATFTSVVGGADSALTKLSLEGSGQYAAVLDSRFHARRILALTASTGLISAIALLPVFLALAAEKTVSCRVNDTFVLLNTGMSLTGSNLQVFVGSKQINDGSAAAVGKCLSETFNADMRNLDTSRASTNIAAYLGTFLADITKQTVMMPLEPLVHMMDAAISYALGIVTAMQDVVASVDWIHCRPPVAQSQDVSKCVCGDTPHHIPALHRQQGGGSYPPSAFWCSGPLLMTAAGGEDVLVWNPFSLEEMLGFADYDSFILCLQTANFANCPRPADPLNVFALQGVELMQVVTRCRGNYQARTWDAGVVLMAVLSLEEWANLQVQSPAALAYSWLQTDDSYTAFRRRWARLSEFMGLFAMDSSVHACLSAALSSQLWQHSCMQQYLLASGSGNRDEFFVYEPSPDAGPHPFSQVDACRSFSGSVSQFGGPNGASHPLSVWSSYSSNPLHGAVFHYVLTGASDQRAALAEQQLQALHAEMVQTLQQDTGTITLDLDMSAVSSEGDEMHQIVDCVLLGPYASADLQASFQLSNGQRFGVSQYHRGDPTSRAFPPGPSTGGSLARQQMIATVLKFVTASLERKTQQEAQSAINRIRNVLSDVNNLRCVCGSDELGVENEPRSMACCRFTTRAGITWPAQLLMEREWNLADALMKNVFDHEQLTQLLRETWIEDKFAFPERAYSEAEQVELRDAYVFNFSKRIRGYSLDEVPAAFGGISLWKQCTQLLSASFFTVPLRADKMAIDVDTQYDPTTGTSARYLHGMEEVIERILAQSRLQSPVFWSHVHRYVPSDSVWCENLTATPTAHPTAPNVFESASIWREMSFAPDSVRGEGMTEVHFVRDPRCLCNWTVSTEAGYACSVPSCSLTPTPSLTWPLREAWQRLCARGSYTSRDDLFLFMEVLLKYHLPEADSATCVDIVPSTVWGLLDTRQQARFYNSSSPENGKWGVDLHELATNGPSGLRLGLLGAESGSLLRYLQEQKLLQPVRSHVNQRYKHTVAQPFCVSNLHEALHTDLSQHFSDVFFPMAHSVHEAPVAAMCSRWVIEVAITRALSALTNVDALTIETQNTTTAVWRLRCAVQLQQLGICALRGVLIDKPASWDDGGQQCVFVVDELNSGCQQLFYVTSSCLVMCDGRVYDPCLCASQSGAPTCDGAIFRREQCSDGLLPDILAWATEPVVQLYSMQWPQLIALDEAGADAQRLQELNTELALVRTARAQSPILDDQLFEQVKQIVLQQAATVEEGSAPDAFCDDVLDYTPADAQHPVGYHPTSTCLRSTTNMRGFANWMSTLTDSDHAYSIDPVRLRNMSMYSAVFGASHLVCDMVAYSMAEAELNAYHLTSRWDPDESADPAVPSRKTSDETPLQAMYYIGNNIAQSQWDHPLRQPASTGPPAFRHSVGLIRDWFGCYTETCVGDSSWPHREIPELDADSEQDPLFLDVFGLDPDWDEAAEACVQPILRVCRSDNECNSVEFSNLVCQRPLLETGELDEEGICASADTCYQHAHCPAPSMCSGSGQCVQPRLYFRNKLDKAVDVQLFALDRTECSLDTYGLSPYQAVDDFAEAHGLCKFRNWFHYLETVQNSTLDGLLRRVPKGLVPQRTNDPDQTSVEERNVLKMRAHPCDRSYQHGIGLGICTPSINFRDDAWLTFAETRPPQANTETQDSLRTWTKEGLIDHCDLMGPQRTGFMNPYTHRDVRGAVVDTLQFVPAEVRMCRELSICPLNQFFVEERSVAGRVVRRTTAAGAVPLTQPVNQYRYVDSSRCGAMGALVVVNVDEAEICTVDHFVLPVLDFVFSATSNTPVLTPLPLNPEFSQLVAETDRWSDASMQAQLDAVLQHCPAAFGSEDSTPNERFTRYRRYMRLLAFSYVPRDASKITRSANTLLLELFGLADGAQEDTNTGRGFSDLDSYLQLAECADYVLGRLQAVKDLNTLTPPYSIESLWNPPVPGDSLYLFREFESIYMPFAWLWRCVITARPDEGGAPRTWFKMLVDAESSELPTCDNYNAELTGTVTIRQKLQRSTSIFELAAGVDGELLAGQMLQEINDLLSLGLDALQISAFPDTFCLRSGETCLASHRNGAGLLHYDTSCFVKLGTNLQELLAAPDADGENSETYNLLAESRGVIFTKAFANVDTFFESSLQVFIDMGILKKLENMEDLVDAVGEGIPRLQFVAAVAFLEIQNRFYFAESDPYNVKYETYVAEDDGACTQSLSTPRLRLGEVLPACQDGCTHLRLTDPEFHVRAPSSVLPRGTHFLRKKDALFFLVRFFIRSINLGGSFRAGSMQPRAIASSRMSTSFTRSVWEAQVTRAFVVDDFMRTKSFECSEDRTYNPNEESNRLHRSLRACLTDLKVPTAWKLSSDRSNDLNVLQMKVPAKVLMGGFLPSFAEVSPGDAFLDDLFSPKWAVERADTAKSICYTSGETVEVMNPYWAGFFDHSTGCDVEVVGEYLLGLRRVDGACTTLSPDQTCAQRFPRFDYTIRQDMPETCTSNYENGVVYSPPQAFSTVTSIPPLCEQKPEMPTECNLRHGTLLFSAGNPAGDLHVYNPVVFDTGIWNRTNRVVRERLDAGYVTNTGTVGLRVLPTDIAGHFMLFDVSASGRLSLWSMPLDSAPLVAAPVQSVQSWIISVEEVWLWQHTMLSSKWPSDRTRDQPWLCPLKWLTAYSGDGAGFQRGPSRNFAARTPSPLRNAARFRIITEDSRFAHATVHSSATMQNLRPGWFVSETLVCTDYARSADACSGASLLQATLQQLRDTQTFHRVQYREERQCREILDWPHQTFRLADNVEVTREQIECNVLGRLPRFAMRRTLRTPSPSPGVVRSSPSVGHACRMGRLPRLLASPSPQPVEYCSLGSNTLVCESVEANATSPRARRIRVRWPLQAAARPAAGALAKNRRRRCAACEDHTQASFVNRKGQSTPLTGEPQLSVGQPVELHVARLIASYLRKAVCPSANETCPALEALFGGTLEDNAPRTEAHFSSFLSSLLAIPPVETTPSTPQDEELWARPWGFCDQSTDQSAGGNRGCSGNLSRAAWLDSKTRVAQCVGMVQTSAPPSAPVQFCKLDGTTEALCSNLARWRLEVDNIVCQASGIASCPTTGFFYSPAVYSIENGAFSHETVQAFYSQLDKTSTCAQAAAADISEQASQNRLNLQQCAAFVLTPIAEALESVRHILGLVIELIYYALQILVSFFNLLVAMVTGQTDQTNAIGQTMVKYVLLLLEGLGQITKQILNALFKLIFSNGFMREMLNLLEAMCEAVNFLQRKVVVEGVCVLIRVVGDVLITIAKTIGQLPGLGGFAESIRNAGQFLQTLDFCNERPLVCKFSSEPDPTSFPSALDIATRCWSTYATFFGDTRALSCTPADTCAVALGQTKDPVMCGSCPEGPASVQPYACAPETKVCTCGVPIITQSPCLSNAECQNDAYNCRYLNSEFQAAAGSIACSSCQTRRVCFVTPGAAVGFCACTLLGADFAQCSESSLGLTVMPAFDELCLLTGAVAARSMLYSADFEAVLTTACSDVVLAVCVSVPAQGYYMLGYQKQGRRLLTEPPEPEPVHVTLCPLCADAMRGADTLPETKQACIRAYATSRHTLDVLGLTELLPPCALCSIEDFLSAARRHPHLIMRVALHPAHSLMVVLRHTPVRHAVRFWRIVRESVHVLADDVLGLLTLQYGGKNSMPGAGQNSTPGAGQNSTPGVGKNAPAGGLTAYGAGAVPPLVRRLAEAMVAWNTSHMLQWMRREQGRGRVLLGAGAVVDAVEQAFTNLQLTHEAYSSQIRTDSRYTYPDLVELPGVENPWLSDVWPPITSAPGDTCSTLGRALEVIEDATRHTVKFYEQRPTPPSNTWWIKLQAAADQPTTATKDDWLTRAAVRVGKLALEAVGFNNTSVYNALYSGAHELARAVRCDFESLQTCSRWNVRLLHGAVIVGVVLGVWVYVCSKAGVVLLGVASVALYVPAVLYLCYGYSPACIPLIPACLLQDIVQQLQGLVPDFVVLPASLLRPGCTMDEASGLFLRDDCIVPCEEAPFEFGNAISVLAWGAAELGLGVVERLDSFVLGVPLLDPSSVSAVREQLWTKYGVREHGSSNLVLGHRICAAVSSYKVLPYLLLFMIALVISVSIIALLLDLLLTVAAFTTTIVVSIFVP